MNSVTVASVQFDGLPGHVDTNLGRMVKLIDDAGQRYLHATIGDDCMGELPIVVETAEVFIALYGVGLNLAAGEVHDRLFDGPAVGTRDVHQHSVHVKKNGSDFDVFWHQGQQG